MKSPSCTVYVGLAQACPKNNTRSLSCTADLSSPLAHWAPLRAGLCKCSYSHTHTHTICNKMAFDLHLIICTWNVVTTCISVTVFFLLRVWWWSKIKRKKTHVVNTTNRNSYCYTKNHPYIMNHKDQTIYINYTNNSLGTGLNSGVCGYTCMVFLTRARVNNKKFTRVM